MSTIAVGERVTFLRATGWQWMLVEAVTGTVTELHLDAAIPFAHVACGSCELGSTHAHQYHAG
jgi:hypothetical protein